MSKGKRQSLRLCWTNQQYLKDALFVDLTMSENYWFSESEVVVEHITKLRHDIMPLIPYFARPRVAAKVCSQCERVLSDMILFISDAPQWRRNVKVDPLEHVLTGSPMRQKIARELKYIDATFELYEKLVKQTDALVSGDEQLCRYVGSDNLSMLLESKVVAEASSWLEAQELLMRQITPSLKTRCMKLLVRLWFCCIFGSNENTAYLHKNGWDDRVNSLNGHGLGSSDVFSFLLRNNQQLARGVDSQTLIKFINFVRVLGPLETWLTLLRSLCVQQGIANQMQQQSVLSRLIYAGELASPQARAETERNRNELLVSFELGEPVGLPLGDPIGDSEGGGGKGLASRDVMALGVHDIAVAWVAPRRWVVGRSVLFHGPKALSLPILEGFAPRRNGGSKRDWVSLCRIMWVLQPERCCEAATGERWEDVCPDDYTPLESTLNGALTISDTVAPDSGSTFDILRSFAKYILAQLGLVADLARDRQMNCIMALQEEYSFSLCLTGASDPRLPTSVRAAFYDILTDLWLDRNPHYHVVVPALMRLMPEPSNDWHEVPAFQLREETLPDVWSEAHDRALPSEVRDFYACRDPSKFEAVTRSLGKYFCAGYTLEQQVSIAQDDNHLTVSAMRALNFLLRFGFVPLGTLRELMGPLVRLLDGRTDFLDFAQANAKNRGSMVEPGADGFAVDAEASAHPEGSSTSMASLAATASITASAMEPLLSTMKSFGEKFKDEGETGTLPRSRFPPVEGPGRYLLVEQTKKIFESKVAMLNALSHSLRLGAHIQISRALHVFRETGYKRGSSADTAATKLIAILDSPVVTLSQLGVRSPGVMLADILMYDDEQLFALAMELIFHHYCQADDLISHLEKVELLTPNQAELFEKIKIDAARFGRLTSSLENWVAKDEYSGTDMQKVQEMTTLCRKLSDWCHLGYPQADTTPTEVQKMLCEVDIYSHIRYVIGLNTEDFVQGADVVMAQVNTEICNLTARFVAGNAKNQTLVFASLSKFEALLDTVPESAFLMAEIFRENADLCSQVPPNLIRHFGSLIARERSKGNFVTWYLDFFCAVVSVGRVAIPANQTQVIASLKQWSPSNMLHLLQGEGTQGWQRVIALAEGFRSEDIFMTHDMARWQEVPENDAEISYCLRSVELLIGLAMGRGAQNLVNRPFVDSLLPAKSLINLMLQLGDPDSSKHHGKYYMLRRLQIRYFELASLLVYDVDVSVLDMDLLAHREHAALLELILRWIQAHLTPGDPSINDRYLDEDDEELLVVMLQCLDSFFNGPYQLVIRRGGYCVELVRIVQEYSDHFGSLLTRDGVPRLAVQLRRPENMQVAAHRIAAATGGWSAGLGRGSVTTQAVKLDTTKQETEWRAMVSSFKAHKTFQDRLQKEEFEIGELFSCIEERTDPYELEYVARMPRSMDVGLADGIDFRRNAITTEDILERFVRYSYAHMRTDVESLRRLQYVLLAMLRNARNHSDDRKLERCQSSFINAGVTRLIIKMLDERVALDVTETSWMLLAEVLRSNGRGQLVNKDVQQDLLLSMDKDDDSGMWESFSALMNDICSKVKFARRLLMLVSRTSEEQGVIDEYEASILYAIKAMDGLRLMVEGHNHGMQQYFFSQHGNARSCNVPEVCTKLLMRLCKNSEAADTLGPVELSGVEHVVRLIVEMAQGPNLRNQSYLTSLGLCETVMRLLASKFVRHRKSFGDLYPPSVRNLKASLAETLLSLLEGRLDTTVHESMLQRIDTDVIRARIEFVHLYFTFGSVGVSSGSIRGEGIGAAAAPLGHPVCKLLEGTPDPSEVYEEMVRDSKVAEELLEDLEESELDELFSEGLSLLELVFILCPHSSTFKEAIMPVPMKEDTFVDDVKKYHSLQQYRIERKLFRKREIYRQAFDNLQRFVKTIEVVLNGELQLLHFQQPLTAMWYVHGGTQQHILETVPLSPPDVKAKAFVALCAEAHRESKHIRELSRYSIVPKYFLKSAQRYLPDGAHRPFQVFLSDDARLMEQLLHVSLFLSFALSAHVGIFLVPDESKPGSGKLTWSSATTHHLGVSFGCLYFACSVLWLSLSVCIKGPLHVQAHQEPDKSAFRTYAAALLDLVRDASLVWRSALVVACGAAITLEHFSLYAFLLLDFFCQSSTLATILRAITTPGKSLAMTFLGASIITFVYASIGFHYFSEDFGDYCDENILTCTQTMMYRGFIGGVVGVSPMMNLVDYGDATWTGRAYYDVTYFVIYGIFILNTIVALIVDSFGALKSESEERARLLQQETFIACIDRQKIDDLAQAIGVDDAFEYHEAVRQHKWDYMAFIFHLMEKDELDHTGPEQMICKMIAGNDTSWLPLGRSKLIEEFERQHSTEDIMSNLESDVGIFAALVEYGRKKQVTMQETMLRLDAGMKDRIEQLRKSLQEMTRLSFSLPSPTRQEILEGQDDMLN
eukprot:TRINITY_DN28410_c0_g2_i2.p1 TRINITY_DN28410_c0_g2~~TRINITY_DN28410_c0_g2_i2.p1  ORF type:complete len:2582 (-),score=551.41 TRINITY_DN28410_c0_g2_i2:34-7299(-)